MRWRGPRIRLRALKDPLEGGTCSDGWLLMLLLMVLIGLPACLMLGAAAAACVPADGGVLVTCPCWCPLSACPDVGGLACWWWWSAAAVSMDADGSVSASAAHIGSAGGGQHRASEIRAARGSRAVVAAGSTTRGADIELTVDLWAWPVTSTAFTSL